MTRLRGLSSSTILQFVACCASMSYVYQSLAGNDKIRVLILRPGVEDATLDFTLEEVPLEACPPFEAISYVWGDATEVYNVSCDGLNLTITESLAAALRRFRHLTSWRTLWADAICINQRDLQERASQVTLMRRIYEQCSGVLLWLGPEDQDTLPAMGLIEQVFQAAKTAYRRHALDLGMNEDHGKFIEFVDLEDFDTGDMLPDVDSAEWLPVKKLYRRPWFQRTWVVQEVTASNNVTVFCGKQAISWQTVGISASWINRQVVKDDFDRWRIFEDTHVYEAVTMFDQGYLQGIDFLGCLNLFRGLLATDPRDKVFALLGLPPFVDVLEKIPPDYTKSKLEVYSRVVEQSLAYHSDLRILSHIHHEEDIETDLPTWVPRWDKAPAAGLLVGTVPGSEYFASGWELTLIDYGCSINSDTLTLHGVILGSVKSVSGLITADDLRDTHKSTSPIREFLRDGLLNFDQYNGNEVAYRVVTHLGFTLTAGTNASYVLVGMEEGSTEMVENHFADFGAWIIQFNPNLSSYRDIHDAFNDGQTYKGNAAQYAVAASRVCDDRKLFLFGDEYIGIGPKAVRSSDDLCVLIGGTMLYVTRKMDNQHYQFIGECYVDGLMHGQGLTDEEGNPRPLQKICFR